MTARKIIRDSDQDDLLIAAAALGISWPEPTIGLSICGADGELEAVIAYNERRHHSCCAHIWSNGNKRWATREALHAMFAIPFIGNGVKQIVLPIAARNVPAQVLALKLGFRFDAKLTDYRDGDDEVLMLMTREECRWLTPQGGSSYGIARALAVE